MRINTKASRLALCLTAMLAAIFATGCNTDASIASRNLSKAAGMFELERRIIFYNSWLGEYILFIEGRCSIERSDLIAVTCKTGPDAYKKHYLGLSGQVTYFSEQLEQASVSAYHYRVIFKPQAILPDVDFRGDAGAAIEAVVPDGRD